MMTHFNNKLLAKAFFWFGFISAFFSVVTELYGQNVYLPSDFYLLLSIFAMTAAVAAAHDAP